MPRPRATSICAEPGCPALSPCPAHTPAPWAGTRGKAGLPPDWFARRNRVLRRDHRRCYICGGPATQVDHIVPHAEGGTSDYANLAAICATDHQAKSLAEATRGRARTN